MSEQKPSPSTVTTPAIHFINGREIHLFHGYVAVCWNINEKETRTRKSPGEVILTTTRTRIDRPYIDFLTIRTGRVSQELYVDEDSPIDGGLNADEAQQLVVALQEAIAHLKEAR